MTSFGSLPVSFEFCIWVVGVGACFRIGVLLVDNFFNCFLDLLRKP